MLLPSFNLNKKLLMFKCKNLFYSYGCLCHEAVVYEPDPLECSIWGTHIMHVTTF